MITLITVCTWEWWCIRDDMWEVKINGLDVRILGGDHVKGNTDATTNINECLHVMKAMIDL